MAGDFVPPELDAPAASLLGLPLMRAARPFLDLALAGFHSREDGAHALSLVLRACPVRRALNLAFPLLTAGVAPLALAVA